MVLAYAVIVLIILLAVWVLKLKADLREQSQKRILMQREAENLKTRLLLVQKWHQENEIEEKKVDAGGFKIKILAGKYNCECSFCGKRGTLIDLVFHTHEGLDLSELMSESNAGLAQNGLRHSP